MSAFDNLLFLWINATTSSPAWLVPVARFASLELPQWLLAATLGALAVGDSAMRRMLLRVLLAMLVAALLARLGQSMFSVSRPFTVGLGTMWLPHGDSSGFPSKHASVVFAFAFSVAAGATRHRVLVGIAVLLLACTVAWSRICLGLHFPSDVLVGAGVGGLSAWIVARRPFFVSNLRMAHEPNP